MWTWRACGCPNNPYKAVRGRYSPSPTTLAAVQPNFGQVSYSWTQLRSDTAQLSSHGAQHTRAAPTHTASLQNRHCASRGRSCRCISIRVIRLETVGMFEGRTQQTPQTPLHSCDPASSPVRAGSRTSAVLSERNALLLLLPLMLVRSGMSVNKLKKGRVKSPKKGSAGPL